MAAPACMSDDGNPAVFVGTFLATGDSVALCDECMVPWSAALLSTMTGVDPAPFIAAISEDVETASEGAPTDQPPPPAPADTDDPTPSPTPAAGRGRKRSGDPPTATENPAVNGGEPTESNQPAAA